MVERKVATVLFADLVDSTGLVASADPEVVRRRVERYFDVVASRIEAYGGTVEKFVGDAVMAAFGVPIAHEDDAERAVRAALEIVPKVEELQLSVRIGVESGEIVIGDSDSTFATGEAVNLAARLQQAAQPGEILLGSAARRLAASAVEVDDAGPLEVKGRTEPLWTWRAIRAHDSSRLDAAPFGGREPELELLENSFSRAVKDRRAQLLTIFGEPGLGKTRLVTEFTAGLERATTLCGRTLPYGEGVTYWPLASMIKASAGIRDDDPASEAFEKLRACCESEAVADLLGAALGVLGAAEGGEHEPGQLSWAALRWAEQLADAQPLVLVFEDVHWAEEPLLDLIEHLARSLREVPVLIIALARPELLDARPAWGGGIRTAAAIDLAPLDGTESGELADALLSRGNVSAAERGPLLERAEGNPLFLEEIVQALREGCGLDGIPETLQALIAARIDGLAAGEKHVLQSAALVGRVFWQGALESLVPDLEVAELLEALCGREFLLREEHSTISGDVAFRFKHGLIRDVAYSGMSKVRRAQEHQAFAAWVEERARDELAEIRAHHLEQAAELLTELDGAVPADLALSAATALEEAGRRALRRGALGIARRTLLRSVELDPSPERRYLAAHAAWRLADVPTVGDEAEEALAEARAVSRHDVEGRALVLLADLALHSDGDVERAHELADEALAILPEDEPAGLYDAHALITMIFWWLGDGEGATRHAEAMLDLAHRAGRPELESLARTQLSAIAGVRGDTAGAVALLEEAESLAESSGSREAMGYALAVHGRRFGESEFDEAEHYLRRALEIFEEIGAAGRYGWTLSNLASVYRQRGELPHAEKTFREAVRRLR
jgi:class 3 adenylate cyclase/tetratricopeptide (TPR) repeat protein